MRSKRGLSAGLLLLGGLGLVAPLDAHAIITRDDLPDGDYVVDDADYPEVVDLFRPGDCTGTLIHESFLLTVAHCAVDLDVGVTLVVDGVDHDVAEVILHPDWVAGPDDIALIRFEIPVVGVTPIPLYRGIDEAGQTLTLVGRGLHATGLEGERGATMDGQLRRATNVVSKVTDDWLEVTFEPPGHPDVTSLEGVGASGDSGGPAFIDNDDGRFVAGLNSWGDANPYPDLGKYGAWDYSTRVSSYVSWIDAEAGTAPPEPPDTPTGSTTPPQTTPPDPTTTTPADTRPEASDPSTTPEESGTCGCQVPSGGGPPVWWAAILVSMGLRRRSTDRRSPPHQPRPSQR